MTIHAHARLQAEAKYRRYVMRARITDLFSRLTGRDNSLVCYETVARHLHAHQQVSRGVQAVPVGQIVGSVSRYHDFTRTFLPRGGADAERWMRLDAALNSDEILPPLDLLRIGELYFVLDGHHRVSVARANAVAFLEAHVTELLTAFSLTLDDFIHQRWLDKISCPN